MEVWFVIAVLIYEAVPMALFVSNAQRAGLLLSLGPIDQLSRNGAGP